MNYSISSVEELLQIYSQSSLCQNQIDPRFI